MTRSSSLPSEWKPLGPGSFPSPVASEDGFRYAKDDEYLRVVLDSWEQDIALSPQRVETSPWIYNDKHGTPLYGHIVRPMASLEETTNPDDGHPLRPGILLFHTAAGPQDVFLFQKAAKLASSNLKCLVFICDVLSDQDGWAWTPDGDRTRFNTLKEELLREDAALLRSRVEAAVRTLLDKGLGVDQDRLASLGWCFGAQPILELAALQHQQEEREKTENEQDALTFSATALVSYHGVYRREASDSVKDLSKTTIETELSRSAPDREVLICTGKSDPFVAPGDLEFARTTMEQQNFAVRIMEFDGAKHGFTNPAQDFNSNPAFQYNEVAAKQSWEATMELLRRKL